jgi:hypothetical protein
MMDEPAMVPETKMGIVIFLDLDDYMGHARQQSAAAELSLSRSLLEAVKAAAVASGASTIRTFGDGFLLVVEGGLDEGALKRAVRFLARARDRVAALGLSFRAAFAAGPYVLEADFQSRGSGVRLIGPAGNLAGKLLGRAGSGELIFAWPTSPSGVSTLTTFEQLAALSPARVLPLGELRVGRPTLNRAQAVSAMDGQSKPSHIDNSEDNRSATGIEFASQIKVYIGEMIKLADDKAKFALTISTGILAYLFNQRIPSIIGSHVRTNALELFGSGMLVTSSALFLMSFAFGAMVLLPRTAVTHPGLIFFGSIAAYPDAESYWKEVRDANLQALSRYTSMHNFEYARVTSAKYKYLIRSMRCLIGGLCFVFIYFVIWDGFMKS